MLLNVAAKGKHLNSLICGVAYMTSAIGVHLRLQQPSYTVAICKRAPWGRPPGRHAGAFVGIRSELSGKLLFAPDAFQHSRILAGRVQLELEIGRVQRSELLLGLLRREHLVGELEVVAKKVVAENFARRSGGEDILQSQSASEDRLEIGDAPLLQLLLDVRRCVLNQHSGKASGVHSTGKRVAIVIGKLDALIYPSGQILADVIEHSQLRVPALQQGAVQVFPGLFAGW